MNDKGFTLIEVLAAITLLGIVISFFLNLSGYDRLAELKSDRENEAYLLLDNVMNQIRDGIKKGNLSDKSDVDSLINSKVTDTENSNPTYSVHYNYLQTASSVNFSNPCTNSKRTSSISSLINMVDVDTRQYILTITACERSN